jgi:hypothetical protein
MIDSRSKSQNTARSAEAALRRGHMSVRTRVKSPPPLRKVHVCTRTERSIRIHHTQYNYCIHVGAIIIDSKAGYKVLRPPEEYDAAAEYAQKLRQTSVLKRFQKLVCEELL